MPWMVDYKDHSFVYDEGEAPTQAAAKAAFRAMGVSVPDDVNVTIKKMTPIKALTGKDFIDKLQADARLRGVPGVNAAGVKSGRF